MQYGGKDASRDGIGANLPIQSLLAVRYDQIDLDQVRIEPARRCVIYEAASSYIECDFPGVICGHDRYVGYFLWRWDCKRS